MGSTFSLLECCLKRKQQLNTPLLDDPERLTRLSDLIENKHVHWDNSSNAVYTKEYNQTISTANQLRNKINNYKKISINQLEAS
jgi:hypothetical protein